jgi:hypothetical protein
VRYGKANNRIRDLEELLRKYEPGFDREVTTRPVVNADASKAVETVTPAPVEHRAAFNSVPLILSLGVALICTAGIVFVTSAWNTLPDVAKIGAILSGAAVFFAAFALARYKLNITNTAIAFYILGCAAVAIAVLSVEILNILSFGATLGAGTFVPFAVATLGAYGGYRLYKNKLFWSLTWILAYVSINFFSLWLFSDVFGNRGWLFTAVPVCVTAFGALFVTVFRAKRYKDKFCLWLSLATFGLSALITAAVSIGYRQSDFANRIVSAFSVIVIFLTLSVMAKKSNIKFLFPLQSLTATWTAHTVSGVIFFGGDWRAALDVTLMLAAFVWSRYNIRREDKISDIAHNLIFPAAVFIALFSARLPGNSIPYFAASLLVTLFYAALMIVEQRKIHQRIYAVLGLIFFLCAYLNFGFEDADPRIILNSHIIFAALIAAIAFARIPKREASMGLQRIFSFAACLLIIFSLAPSSVFVGPGLWRAGFMAGAAVIALADAIASADKTRKAVSAITVYALSLWAVDGFLSCFGFWNGAETAVSADLRLAVTFTLTTIILVVESLLFHKKGTAKRLTFVVAVIAYSLSSLYSIAFLAFTVHETGNAQIYILQIVLGAAGSYIIYRRERAHADVLAACALIVGLMNSAPNILECFAVLSYQINYAVSFIILAAFALIMCRGRRGYANLRVAWAIPCIGLVFSHSMLNDYGLIRLCGGLLLSTNFLQYLTSCGKSRADRAMITASAAIATLAAAYWTRYIALEHFAAISPFYLEIFAAILVAGTFAIARRLWKMNEYSHWAAFAITLLSAAVVYFEAADDFRLARVAIVTAGAIGALAMSLRIKRGRWFVFGFGAATIIFFRETSEFWLSVKWWAYLLAVGFALVSVAAVSESGRRKGSGLAERLRRSRIREWRW